MNENRMNDDLNPVISVIITAFNYGHYIGQAIESVLNQDFTDFELIITNNASTDNTDEVVRRYLHDKRIRYHVNEKNIGVLANYNLGLKLSRAQYIFWLSADDFLLPECLSTLYSALNLQNDIDFVYAKYLFTDATGQARQEINHRGWLPYEHATRPYALTDLLMFDVYISMCTVLFRRSVFEKYGEIKNYDMVAGDYAMFCELIRDGYRYLFIDKRVVAFRLHGKQLSNGEYVPSGNNVADQIRILDLFFTPENFQKLAGCENHILALLSDKMKQLEKFPQKYNETLGPLSPVLRSIINRARVCEYTKVNSSPMVTVILTTGNNPGSFNRALSSIFIQTFPSYEVIIVNTGITDIGNIINEMDKHGVTYCVQIDSSKGIAAARNAGLQKAKGRFIAYLQENDAFYPDHLRMTANYLDNYDQVSVVYTNVNYISIDNTSTALKSSVISSEFDRNRLLNENYLPAVSIVHRRECINTAGVFNEEINCNSEWDMWKRLSENYLFCHINATTAEVLYTQ